MSEREVLVKVLAAMLVEDRVLTEWGIVDREKRRELLEKAGMKAVEEIK